jgi:hypothetical protein
MARWPRISLTTAVVVMSAVLPITAAQAAGPSPQQAPATTPAPSPSPDPAPSARPHHSTTTGDTHLPVSTPSDAPVSTPVQRPAVSAPASRINVTRTRPRPHHAVARKVHRVRPRVRHHSATARHSSPVARPVRPVVAIHPAARPAASHNSGAMLLVGALVLLVLVGASLSLLRVANRLHREIMGSAT